MQWCMLEWLYIYKNECEKHIFIISKTLEHVWFGGNFEMQKSMQRHVCFFQEVFRGIYVFHMDVLYADPFSESNSPRT